jgi:hypothetical protein
MGSTVMVEVKLVDEGRGLRRFAMYILLERGTIMTVEPIPCLTSEIANDNRIWRFCNPHYSTSVHRYPAPIAETCGRSKASGRRSRVAEVRDVYIVRERNHYDS